MSTTSDYDAAQPEIDEMFLACSQILQDSSDEASVHVVIGRLLAVALSCFPEEIWPAYLDKILATAKLGARCVKAGGAP